MAGTTCAARGGLGCMPTRQQCKGSPGLRDISANMTRFAAIETTRKGQSARSLAGMMLATIHLLEHTAQWLKTPKRAEDEAIRYTAPRGTFSH